MYPRSVLCVFLALLCFIQKVNGQAVLDIKEVARPYIIQAQYLSVWEDSARSRSIEDVLALSPLESFRPFSFDRINLGFSESGYWVKLRVKNSAQEQKGFVLQMDNDGLGEVQLYKVRQGQVLYTDRNGSTVNISERNLPIKKIGFELDFDPQEEADLYLYITSYGDLWIGMSLLERYQYFQEAFSQTTLLGLYYGMMAVVILFALSFFAMTREHVFLFFGVFTFFGVAYTLSVDGYFGVWLTSLGEETKGLYSALTSIFGAMWFLKLMDYFPGRHLMTPILIWARRAIWTLQIVAMLLMTVDVLFARKFNLYVYIGVLTWSAILVFRGLLKKDYSTRYLFLGYLFLIAAVALTVMQHLKILHTVTHVQNYFYGGYTAFVLSICLGLGDRFKRFSKEREEAIIEKTAASTRILSLNHQLEEANQQLEQKVDQRTSELQEKNDQLVKAKEAAESAANAKANFLATMSHEIRTPLNGVVGMTELVMTTELSAEQQEQLQIIRNSSENLLTIINDILDFSKVESGKLKLENRDTHLTGCVKQVIELFTPQAEVKKLKLYSEVGEAVPERIMGDRVRLSQILTNLVSNALKFTERGSVRVTLESLGKSTDGQKVDLKFGVHDTGIGIPQDKIDRLFQAFEQVDTSTTRKFGGTGLGLAICKRLVHLMGGNIWIESEIGKGTSFYFTLALTLSDSSFSNQDADMQNGMYKEEKKLNAQLAEKYPFQILVVEDNKINQRIAEKIFRSLGYAIEIAADGRAGYERIMEGKFDLVMMDMQMPVLDGLEATRLIRSEVDSQPIIIAMTANALQEDRDRCMEAGMDDYLSKPIKPSDIQAVLSKWGEVTRRRSTTV
ncbi:MAG: ATP-binding protein [Bacteroidota bacterium]